MLHSLRRWLYQYETLRKNRRTLQDVRAHLEQGSDLLIVHQMGRAASMTVTSTLRAAGVPGPVLHSHWMNPASVAHREAHLRRRGLKPSRFPLNVRMSQLLSREAAQRLERHRWRLVSVVRDPIARNVSVFFLSIDDFLPDFHRRYAAGEISHGEIRRVFLERFPHDQPLRWFDEEVRDVFGIDVFAAPPLDESGYDVLRNEVADLLVIKVERLADCFRAAFRDFLGIEVPELVNTHVTERDERFYMYRDFVRDVRLPREYVDRMYESRYARHFYTDAEREAFRRKWLGEPAARAVEAGA
ncbi:putative capsular polysaccharide synthesis family protein [Spiribacter halobius]|nr:putative capsular polysaccharide synthesis family protein [Spiribacter halobius]UEX77326.1 putative capsular polysaccharide synthesis family protein [Spiribacter halobius]